MTEYTRLDQPRSSLKVAADQTGICLVKDDRRGCGSRTIWLSWSEVEDLHEMLGQLFSGDEADG